MLASCHTQTRADWAASTNHEAQAGSSGSSSPDSYVLRAAIFFLLRSPAYAPILSPVAATEEYNESRGQPVLGA
jgi:hypothetical protein